MVRSKKCFFYVAAGIFFAVILILLSGCGKEEQGISDIVTEGGENNADTVLYLDGSPVSAEEYGMLAKENSSQISMQYTTDQVNQEDFWETEIDGETPYSRLAELVEEQLKENYAVRDLAVEMDLTENYTFSDLLDSMEQENEDRADTSGSEISYGLSSFDEASYYKYWYSNLETQVENELIQSEVQVTEDDCREYYDENPEAYTCDVGVKVLYAEISEDDPGAWNMARQLCAALKSGASETEIQDTLDISLEELELNSIDTQAGLSGIYENRWEIASELSEGQVYGPYEDQGAICVMKCLERQDGELVSFAQVKSQIERYLQVQEAQNIIQDRVSDMEVEQGSISEKEAILQAVKS